MGVVLNFCSKFSVSSDWGRRSYHCYMGKLVATPIIMLKKCFKNALMATSDTLSQWHCGGTSVSAQCCCMRVFMLLEHSLSWICVLKKI